jgi:hypothetical protein
MENYATTSSFDTFELQVTPEAQGYLKTAANWAIFLCILVFIFLGFNLLFSFAIIAAGAAGAENADLPVDVPFAAIGIVSLIFNVVGAIPVIFLFGFANKVKRAISEVNTVALTNAFKSLKSHYMFLGIYAILFIVLTIAFFILVLTLAASMSGTKF